LTGVERTARLLQRVRAEWVLGAIVVVIWLFALLVRW